MRSFCLPMFVACLLLCVPKALPQSGNHHFPSPPEPLDQQNQKESPHTITRHVDFAQAQREADDLSRLSQTIPTDVASMRKGMLPKDVTEKLKQIEKLSKKLRGELTD